MANEIRSYLRKIRGFTLMELLIVIAIIAILTVALLPTALKAPAKARDAVKIKKLNDIQTAVEASFADLGTLPSSALAAPFCFTTTIATNINMPEAPKDPSRKGSCSDDADKNDLYFFKSVTGGNQFYIIGAKTEIQTNSNTTKLRADLNGIANYTNAKAALDNGSSSESFRIVVGPL